MFKNLELTQEMLDYIANNTNELHPAQKEILKYNKTLGELQKMQISETQANFLQLIIKIANVKNCLEVGTFTGFSALSMALALPDDGLLVTLDKDKRIIDTATNFFKKANLDKKILPIVAPALDTLKKMIKDKKIFDLIFIDADKGNYINYFNSSLDLIKSGSIVIIDNVLWHGDAYDNNKNDKQTHTIREFNSYVKSDKRVEKFIIPLGDGLTVCRKL